MQNVHLSNQEKQFIELLYHYCELAGIIHYESILSCEYFFINNVPFRLNYSPLINQNIVCVLCDFGHVPKTFQKETYKALLESNFIEYDGMSTQMSVCPITDQIMSTTRLFVEPLTAKALDSFIRYLSQKATKWRQEIKDKVTRNLEIKE